MEVECIDDSNRPNDIPTSKWVVKGNPYTVIGAARLPMQNGMMGYKLAEVNLDGCAPYQFYAAWRFRIKEAKPVVEEEKVEELVEELA